MSSPSLLEIVDGIVFSEHLLERLGAAASELSQKQGLKDEKAWLEAAVERLTRAREGTAEVLQRAMQMPELAALREEHARQLQQEAVDSVERLQAGVTFHFGSRAPLAEALFGKLKLAVLRKVDREDFERFAGDFEKRLGSGYVKRMLADPACAPLELAVEHLRQAFGKWRAAFSPEPLQASDMQAIRDELDALARDLDLPMRQARLLAEAACAPVKGLYETAGIGLRPKRRSVKAVVTDVPEALPEEHGEVAEAVAPKRQRKKSAPSESEAS